MKKKILFIMPSLQAGGAEKCLVNLLNEFDYNNYDVDLLLLNKTGIFLKLLPQQVKIITLQDDFAVFSKNILSSFFNFLLKGKFSLAYSRIAFTYKNRRIKNSGFAEQYSWKDLKKAIPTIDNNYDVAIGFLEKTSIYLTVDKVVAKQKIGFVNNDYKMLNLDSKFDEPYFSKLDYLFTVSESCEEVLKDSFPSLTSKIKMMYNILSEKAIQNLANEKNDELDKGINLVTLGRLSHQKGFDIAIKSCAILKQKGIDFKWYILGEGEDRKALEQLIIENDVAANFILLGIKENPYPYINNATIYVQPSRFEGKSLAIDEAKILHKPILVSNFPSAKDQITHLESGIIVPLDAESIAIGIENLIEDSELRAKLVSNLKMHHYGTESEINKLYQLIDN
ncbi:glycosyltransferase [Flavobacterium sp.]|uniref:glycosyltransferase n=1 Tax=Flavobacterium sp. TaxID=239 RepID=UPI002609439B|nr:glycosyltransferase [Flavobacterium sp.]